MYFCTKRIALRSNLQGISKTQLKELGKVRDTVNTNKNSGDNLKPQESPGSLSYDASPCCYKIVPIGQDYFIVRENLETSDLLKKPKFLLEAWHQ